MLKLLQPIILSVALLFVATTAQKVKLYEEFDPTSTVSRFGDNTKQGTSYRLPNNTTPLRYDISLSTRIDLGDFNFNGNVKIRLQANEVTNTITIHSKMLEIMSVTLLSEVGAAIIVTNHVLNPVTEFLIITTSTPLLANFIYTLDISYSGALRTGVGFYRTSYTNQQGVVKWLATTQFQESDARHAFPCYDEPGIRAIYGLQITHGRTYHAVANMPIKTQLDTMDPDTITTVFDDSVVMQTYLNAFVVSDYKIISNAATKLPNELLQEIYGRPEYIDNGLYDFALDTGVKILTAMEKHFNIKYPLPKMTQIGIPGMGGAMENWGLVTYGENALTYNPATSPFTQLDTVAGIIAHEYAHQWFGNLIGPKWWEFLWLNEGFATLYSEFATNLVYPEWRMNDYFLVNTVHSVMVNDAYESTRPMNLYVESQADVGQLFDFVAYSKSASVLRMMQHVLTDATFTKGLNYYLTEMQFHSADPDDLYRNLERAAREDNAITSNVNIKAIMDSWANQKGYPVIYVQRSDDGVVTVTQDRFLLERRSAIQPQSWWIPFNFVVANNPDFSQTTPDGWMPQFTNSIAIQPNATKTWTNDEWIIFNKQQTGYYHVNYERKLWLLIADELIEGDYTKIHLLNRAQLIDDAYNSAKVNAVSYDIVFSLMEYLSKELDYIPWVPANRVLTLVDRMMASTDSYEHFRTFVHHMVQPIFERLGERNINNEPYFDRLARNIALKWACYMGSEECLKLTSDRIKNYLATGTNFEADVRSTVFCNGMRQADEEIFMGLWNKMQTSTVQADRNLLITSLGCSQDPELLKVLLETTIADTGVNYSSAERANILTAVVQGGVIGVDAVMEFLDVNFAKAGQMFALTSSVSSIANWISSPEYNIKFWLLVDKLAAQGLFTAQWVSTIKTTIDANLQWSTTYGSDISEYLSDYIERSTGSGMSLFVSTTLFTLANGYLIVKSMWM